MKTIFIVTGKEGRKPVAFSTIKLAEEYQKVNERDAELGGCMSQQFYIYEVELDGSLK